MGTSVGVVLCLTTAVSQVGLTEGRFAYIHSLVYL